MPVGTFYGAWICRVGKPLAVYQKVVGMRAIVQVKAGLPGITNFLKCNVVSIPVVKTARQCYFFSIGKTFKGEGVVILIVNRVYIVKTIGMLLLVIPGALPAAINNVFVFVYARGQFGIGNPAAVG